MSKALESKFFQSLLGLPGKVSLHTILSLTLTNIIIMIFRQLEAGIFNEIWSLVALFLVFFICWMIYVIGERLVKKYFGVEISSSLGISQ